MKQILLFILLLSTLKSYSQNRVTNAYDKVMSIYETTSMCCIAKPRQCSIFLNRPEKGIDIIDYLIPLTKVEVKYFYSEQMVNINHFVKFECLDGNCIFFSKTDGRVKALSVPFLSKAACYKFIDAISELKSAFQNL